MHIYQFLPYVLSTSLSTHPKRLTWDKKRPPFYIFRHYATYRKLRKKNSKKIRKFFSSIFSFLRAFVVSSCRKSGFRVFLSLRYGANLGRSRLVCYKQTTKLGMKIFLKTQQAECYNHWRKSTTFKLWRSRKVTFNTIFLLVYQRWFCLYSKVFSQNSTTIS